VKRNTKGHEADTNGHEEEMSELLFKDEVYAIVGTAMEVWRELRSGFAESVYQEAFELELRSRGISFRRQVPLRIKYKEHLLEKCFIADLICYSSVLVELKAISATTKADEAQVINYLKATGLRVGLLINFGDPGRLEWHRFVV
jgi:GxxExxY protein